MVLEWCTLSHASQVELQDVFAGKKGILVGVPGAFTPGTAVVFDRGNSCAGSANTCRAGRKIRKGVLETPNNVHAGCSKTHLPGYVNDYQKLKDAGAEVIVVTAGVFFSPHITSLSRA
jgi:peroxiredoxin